MWVCDNCDFKSKSSKARNGHIGHTKHTMPWIDDETGEVFEQGKTMVHDTGTGHKGRKKKVKDNGNSPQVRVDTREQDGKGKDHDLLGSGRSKERGQIIVSPTANPHAATWIRVIPKAMTIALSPIVLDAWQTCVNEWPGWEVVHDDFESWLETFVYMTMEEKGYILGRYYKRDKDGRVAVVDTHHNGSDIKAQKEAGKE